MPVAYDCWYGERTEDAVGEFYRRVVYQREGTRKGKTTQGFYLFDPAGELYRGWNNRDPEKLVRYLREVLETHAGAKGEIGVAGERDDRFLHGPPEGSVVVDVFSRILDAEYGSEANRNDRIFRGSTGRDHLWILEPELGGLTKGELPDSLVQRITRYHLVDNTRGEPPFWRREDVETCDIRLRPIEGEEGRFELHGRVALTTADGERKYRATLFGEIDVDEGRLTRFDVVARGTHAGHGRWNRNDAPKGEFTLAIAFEIAAKGDANWRVPPQGLKAGGSAYFR